MLVNLPFTPTFTHVTSERAPGQAERQAPAPTFYGCGHQGRGEATPGAGGKQRPHVNPGPRGSKAGRVFDAEQLEQRTKSHLPGVTQAGLRRGTG